MPLIEPIPADYYPTPQAQTRVRDEAAARFQEWAVQLNEFDGPASVAGLVITQARGDAQQTIAAWDATIVGQAGIQHGPGLSALAGHLGADPDGDLLIYLPPAHPGQPGAVQPLQQVDAWSTNYWNEFQVWLGSSIAPWGPFQRPQDEEEEKRGA